MLCGKWTHMLLDHADDSALSSRFFRCWGLLSRLQQLRIELLRWDSVLVCGKNQERVFPHPA